MVMQLVYVSSVSDQIQLLSLLCCLHFNCYFPGIDVFADGFLCLSADSDSVWLEPDSLSQSGGDDLKEGVQFSIWVSFYEIYNEFLYDLLDASPSHQPRKRVTLRLSDDKQGNSYVKGNSGKCSHIYLIGMVL